MSTRIDRLFLLLEDGQSSLVRQTAAQQIGEICEMDRSKLDVLLDRAYKLLFDDKWESRTAGGLVIDEILKHVSIVYNNEDNASISSLTVQGYAIDKVIRNKNHLTQSNAQAQHNLLDTLLKHNDIQNDLIPLLLLQRIGIISTEDLSTLNTLQAQYLQDKQKEEDAAESKQNDTNSDFDVQKMESYLQTLNATDDNDTTRKKNKTKKKKLKDEDFKLLMTVRSSLHPKNELTEDDVNTNTNTRAQCIVFNDWYRKLIPFLLHSNWKYRHGAGIGLRSFLRKSLVCDSTSNLFTEGCLVCLSVLILDRFVDYQSDILVAPISETVAQCLSLFMKYIDNASFISVIKLLFELCLAQKQSWNIRYGGYLAFKYILAVHHQRIIAVNDDGLIKQIIEYSCNGIRDKMEDVGNMASQVLLSNISVFIVEDIDAVFDALLHALHEINDEYSSSTMGIMSVLQCVLNEFRGLMIEYLSNTNNTSQIDKQRLFSNIANILLKIMNSNHSSIAMKKQSIVTLHTFMRFVTHLKHEHKHIAMDVMKSKKIIVLIESVFEAIMSEEHKKIKQTIDVVKDNDFDEYQMDLQYKAYLKQLHDLWCWISDVLIPSAMNTLDALPTEYQHMILKLFQILQKYAIFINKNTAQNDNKKEDESMALPTAQVLKQIEERKQSKKRKHDEDNSNEPPTKKRKLNTTHNERVEYGFPQEMTLWDIIDEGCKLLSKLFTSQPFNALSWSTVEYLILQFLCQDKKKKKRIVYGWRRILGCWLLSDCYQQMPQHNANTDEQKEDKNTRISAVLDTLRNISHCDLYESYDEFKFRRRIITNHTRNLIKSFEHCAAVYDEMNTYFGNNTSFQDYIFGVSTKYNEWKVHLKERNPQREECYKLLLATVLNAQYALDYHDLLLQCSVSHISVCSGDVESVLEPMMSALKNGQQSGYNLQYRSAECVALVMKSLADVTNDDVLRKIWNNIVEDCRDNICVVPKDSTRMAIQCICDVFGEELFNKLPFIVQQMTEILADKDDEDWISHAQILSCLISSVSTAQMREKYLLELVQNIMFDVIDADEEEDDTWSIGRQSRHCIVEYVQFEAHVVLPLIIQHVIPNLQCDDVATQLGVIRLIFDILHLIDNIQNKKIKSILSAKCKRYSSKSCVHLRENGSSLLMDLIPYLSLLSVPLLECMTSFDDEIREGANQIFSICVRLIPLEIGATASVPSELSATRDAALGVLKQLISPSSMDEFACGFEYNASLRRYQQDGLNWLWFLHEFHLHGILADDMGLGKTLQALLVIAASYNTYPSHKSSASLIVCPSSLLYHWQNEVNKFIPSQLLRACVVDGTPSKRQSIYKSITRRDADVPLLVIVSYNTMKNDIDSLSNNKWHYLVLDEGHLIRNPRSKIARAVKTIGSKYRLILSGTPIQNNVLDLWSLFDFLMPGLLGSEKCFKSNFSRPIIDSFAPKSSYSAQRLGARKLRDLHKQCLPFIMRRLKCDVLKELPPKIIQDVEVNMSGIQRQLYSEFVAENALSSIESLLYLRKLVVHPALVMTPQHPSFKDTLLTLQTQYNLSLESIEIAPKFMALRALIQELLLESATEHRMLVFVQFVDVMQLICRALLDPMDVKYATLHGGLSAQQRFEVVQDFNRSDSSLSLLLLTVNVGGLGLNLNTADCVVFMEMDWNPMKDLQAMDRAHRIGQNKTVHVFRIIVRNTIEWQIINKQRFKQYCANAVIKKENKSLQQMQHNSGSILDLFYMNQNADQNHKNVTQEKNTIDSLGEINQKTKKQNALTKMLDTLANMTIIHDEYNKEYDLKTFISNL
eukprot:176501_1